MDKDKIIESLQSLIDELRENYKPRYELRFWNSINKLHPIRPDDPDILSNDLEYIRGNFLKRIKLWYDIEVYDTHENKVIIKYKESI